MGKFKDKMTDINTRHADRMPLAKLIWDNVHQQELSNMADRVSTLPFDAPEETPHGESNANE